MIKRYKIRVMGRVQGVGFRPTVYRYAKEFNLAGWVTNSSRGVEIEIEGEYSKAEEFITTLRNSPPPQSRIENMDLSEIPVENDKEFRIIKSRQGDEVKTEISPDIATCDDCRRELFDPSDRRYRYPFINCTNCGPRFTIIKGIPYDRPKTTMDKFELCEDCHREYEDPMDRRFHAQPNACPVCGPHLTLLDGSGKTLAERDDALRNTVSLLEEGKIVAVKGLGGFHLACDALNDDAVRELRRRKYRYDKPFAVMAADIATIRKYCTISKEEESLLGYPECPIVLLKRMAEPSAENVSEWVAPGNDYLGFMLAYTPIHHLLFDSSLSVLVMTSGNTSQEPIAFKNDEALSRLSEIADFFLIHNRPIRTRCDDSVTRIFHLTGKEYILRRSRGYVPEPLKAPFHAQKQILACGGHFNNTFALMKNDDIFPGHHIGDLENMKALSAFEDGIKHLQNLLEISPDVIACDLHPEYLSTKYARERAGQNPELPLIQVQHHHAHIASCMAENALTNRKVIGVAFDGTGFGKDATVWGGEFLVADYGVFDRAGHLKRLPMPGGEAAIREPWRMAAVLLHDAFGDDFLQLDIDFNLWLDRKKWDVLKKMIKTGTNTPMTSSMGRLFDAVSALLGIRARINYQGQAAIEMEQVIGNTETDDYYPFEIRKEGDHYIIDPGDMTQGLVDDIRSRSDMPLMATRFHNTVAQIILSLCRKIRSENLLNDTVLSGGVFQNMYLLKKIVPMLEKDDFSVHIHQKMPTNDGCIAHGQAVIAAFRTNSPA